MCILSGAVGLFYLLFDPVVRSIVLNKLTLSRSSDTFYIWEDPKISPHFKVYFWNFSNPEAFFAGKEKPQLKEVGPYTYRQKWLKQNITWHDNGTISYRTRKIFTFSPSESCDGCNDVSDNITTLNVPAISAYYQMREAFLAGYALTAMIRALGYNMWSTKTVKEFLWGHEEKLFKIAIMTNSNPPPFEDFGFFLKKNTSREDELGMYTMYTGQGDPYKLSNIASFNGKNNLGRWNHSECDKVHGSDGASFNPYIQQKDTLWFFNDQLCRAMPLIFDKEVVSEGLPGFRFRPREDVFMSPERFPKENACFGGEGKVTGDGVFDVTICQFNAPIVLSWPHFLHAESKFSDNVQGMSPDKEKHGFWFDIQPTTGTTLSAKARVQINVAVRNSKIFSDLGTVKDTVVPVLWFEEGIDELGDDIIKVLKTAAVDPAVYRQYILYCFIGLISTVMLLGVIALARVCKNRASVAKVKKVREILKTNICDLEQAGQPMLNQDSTDSSRVTTATHSRNCSEGARPIFITDVGGDKLMDKLPQFMPARAPPYNAIQTMLDGEDSQDLEASDSTDDVETQGSQDLPSLESAEAVSEVNEADKEQAEVGEKENGYEVEEEDGPEEDSGPSVVLINSRHRVTSTSSSTFS